MSPSNAPDRKGSLSLSKWAAGLAVAAALGAGGHAGYTVTSTNDHNARIAVLESEIKMVHDELTHISAKLDRLIERSHK